MSGESKENKSNENKFNEKKTQQPQVMTYTPLPQKPGGYQLRRTFKRRVKNNCTISGGKKKTRKRKKRRRKRKMTRRKRGRGKTRKNRQRRKRHRRTRRKKAGCWPFCKPKVADDINTPLLQGSEEKQQSDWASTLQYHKPDDLYVDKDNYIYNNITGEKTDKMWISEGKRYITGVTDKKTGKKYRRARLYGQG